MKRNTRHVLENNMDPPPPPPPPPPCPKKTNIMR